MPILNIDNVKIGDKVSYADIANPYQDYVVVATPEDLPNKWGYKEFRVRDRNGAYRNVMFGQYGWNHHPAKD